MTKRILFFSMALLMCFFFSLSLSAQKVKPDDVPSEVKQTLSFEHPTAKVSAWVLEDDQYVATFKEEGTAGKAYFKSDGEWVKSTFSIPKKQLPPLLSDYVIENYPGFSYGLIQLRYVPDERMHYLIELKSEDLTSKNSSWLTFNENGELLTREDPPGFISPVKEKPSVKEKEPAKEKEREPAKEKEERNQQVAEKEKTKKAVAAPEENDDEQEQVAKKEKAEKKEVAEREKSYEKERSYDNEYVSSSKVPEPVKKELSKKIPRPETTDWYVCDTFFVAKCLYKEQQNEVFITQKGKWEKTYTELTELAVTGNILKHLNSFHNGWKFKAAIKETRADREDRLLVDIYEKANWKQKLVTSLLFDKSGKLIKTFDPEYDADNNKKGKKESGLEKYYWKMSVESIKDKDEEIPEVVIKAFKAKYPKVPNPQWSEEGDSYYATYMGAKGKEIVVVGQAGTLLQIQTANKLELVTDAIKSYVKKNHKGFKITEFFSVRELQTKQNLYRVIIQNKAGATQDLWFTTSGKFVE